MLLTVLTNFAGKRHMAKPEGENRHPGVISGSFGWTLSDDKLRSMAPGSPPVQDAALRFRLGRLVIEKGAGKSARDQGVSQAVDQVLKRLTELDEIVEIRRNRRSVRSPESFDQAAGFLIKVAGIGPTLVVKPGGATTLGSRRGPIRRVLGRAQR